MPALDGLRFDGILLDLGISSHQIDDAARGFSFREGAPLDMRMGERRRRPTPPTCSTNAEERGAASIFREYGDEPRAARLAREVVRRRDNAAVRDERRPRRRHPRRARPAQRRRRISRGSFRRCASRSTTSSPASSARCPRCATASTPGGTLAVIAYHSGEDRIVKHAFREWSTRLHLPAESSRCAPAAARALGETLTRRAVDRRRRRGRAAIRAPAARGSAHGERAA